MNQPPSRQLEVLLPSRGTVRSRLRALLRSVALMLVVGLLAFALWPYVSVWRLDLATRSRDPSDLAPLVDIEAIRSQIKQRLNKEADSSIDTLSDPFIHWLDAGIQTIGSQAVDRLVTLAWVSERLLAHSRDAPDRGFLGQLTYAFFDGPSGFRLRIGPENDLPVHARMRLDGFSWRVEALYY
jgi:hypothetical protein